MQTVLVTGGAGFIGSAIVRSLVKQRRNVRVLDNFSTGKKSNLKAVATDIEVIEGDLRDHAALTRAVQGIDTIFHEAAFVSVPQSMEDPETCDSINVHGTVALLNAARKAAVRRVVLASSAAVYGEPQAVPIREDSPLSPQSPYAVSKRVNELYAELYSKVYQLETVCLRYFNVYGPHQPPDSAYAAAIPIFLNVMLKGGNPTIFGDGGQARDFVFVEDIVEANLLAAEAAGAPGNIFNICSAHEISILELIETLARVLDRDVQPTFQAPRPGDIYRSVGSPQLAQEILGFSTKTKLEEGLRKTAAWMTGG